MIHCKMQANVALQMHNFVTDGQGDSSIPPNFVAGV